MRRYDVKTKVAEDGKPISLGYKYPNESYKIRSLTEKHFYSVGDIATAGLYGRDKFPIGCNKWITVTEGEGDALSLNQVVNLPVVSVQSAATAYRDCVTDRDYLNSFERIYFAFDGDAAGREALQRVAKLFDYNKVFVLKFDRHKDASDYLQAGHLDELRNIWHNAKRYLPENIISSLDEFKKLLKDPPVWGIKYPFPTLSAMTYGIRPAETVLITAQEGVGKTEILHAIEHKLLTETNDNVGAIFLEEPKQRHLQALAGVQLKRPVHLPDSGCSPDQVVAALEQVLVTDDRLHLYSHYGSDDPDVLLDTIRFLVTARRVVYVLLDHITMAVSGLAGEDERRALDYLATRLEMMVKELGFSLIVVSHVNDLGQTRGSRLISKVCDIRVDVIRDIVNPDPIIKNTCYLTISKNRPIGKTGPAGALLFDPLSYSYTEVANDNRSIETVGKAPIHDQHGMAA